MTLKKNPVFWLMWLLPGAAVCASLATLAIAIDGADARLPASFHWEGEGLDQDFERARRAAELGVAGTLEYREASHEFVVRLDGEVHADALLLLLTHPNDAARDRQLLLRRSPAGEYLAASEAPPAARWRLSLSDAASAWALRMQVEGDLRRVTLRARDPGGRT